MFNSNSVVPQSQSSHKRGSQSELSGYDEFDAESRLPFRSIPTQTNGMARAQQRKEDNGNAIDLTKSNIYNPNNVDSQYAIRNVPIAQYLLIYISNDCYRISSIFAVIIALFAYDFARTLSYSEFDNMVEFTLMAIFVFLIADCLVQSIVYKSYPGSFFFWLDLVGTITLLADISFTYAMFGYTQADLTVARGGRAGRAARTAGTLRIAKMTRLIRLARVLRQFKLMIQNSFTGVVQSKQSSAKRMSASKSLTSDDLNIPSSNDGYSDELDVTEVNTRKNQSQTTASSTMPSSNSNKETESSESKEEDAVAEQHSSRIGVRVADSITRNVVFGILLTVCLVPIFNYTEEESYSAMYLALDLFNNEQFGSQTLNNTIQTFLASEDGKDVYYLDINGRLYEDNSEIGNILRETETLTFSNENAEIKLSIAESVQFEHAMAIGFTLLIVFLFASLAFMISRNISKLVVRPIEKMTRIVQEFTKNICLLGGDLDNQHKFVTELLETDVIEAAITTLGTIFSSLIGGSDSNGGNQDKLGTLSEDGTNNYGSKHALPTDSDSANSDSMNKKHSFIAPLSKTSSKTMFKSRESCISIQITQQKRVAIEDDEIFARIKKLEQSGDIDSFYIKKEHIPEFHTLSTVMQHPIACEYFRLYCISHMLSESYFFVKAVSEYRESIRTAFLKVFNQHISDKSNKKISILEKDSKKLYDEFKNNNFGIRIFDNARRDIVASLSAEAFNNFLQSKFAHAYVKSRDTDKKRYSHVFNMHPSSGAPPKRKQ